MADAIIMREAPVVMPTGIVANNNAAPSPIVSSPVGSSNINGGGSDSRNNASAITNNNTAALAKKFKGEKISCGDLRKYLYSFEIYRQASMLRKGREVHKIYVDVHKGVNFLDDRFTLTEFGKMVLDNGSVRAGRARNVRQIVVARETLYCSGTGGCKRACGGYGSCVSGCDRIKVRGHKCSFRVKLTMRLGFVDSWFVEILGSHNCYLPDNTPSDLTSMISDYDVKNSDGEDSNSLRSSPLSDSSLLTMSNQSHIGGDSATAPFLQRSPPPGLNLNHLSSTPTPFPPMTSYPLNIPIFPESYLMTMARNAALLNNSSSTNNETPKIGKVGLGSLGNPISHIGLPGLKREGINSSDIVVPEIMNAFLPSALMPRFGAFPTPAACISPQILTNGLHKHQNLPVAGGSNHNIIDSSNDVLDLTKPRVKKEERENDDYDSSSKAYDLSMPSSPTSNVSLYGNSGSIKPLNLNGFHSLPLMSERNSPPLKKYNREMNNVNNFSIPKSLSSSSHPSAFNSILLPSTTPTTTSVLLQNSKSSLPSPQPFGLSLSSSMPAATSALAGKLCEKARKAICRRLDNHFLGSTSLVDSPHLKTTDQQNVSDSNHIKIKQEEIEKESDAKVPLQSNNIVDESADVDGADDPDCDIGAEMDKDLINRVHQLESHVTQLRNVILKKDGGKEAQGKKGKTQRQFDFNKYNTRHVALKVAYLGWDYHGFVVQEDNERTVEAALFEALIKTKLVENRETSNYHRCGRTDKGVSALGQVISIDLRTNLLEGVGVKTKEGGAASTRQGDTKTEINYCHILNKVLPPEIRVLAWAPVQTDFSARFSCKKRTYKYFFPKGDLDIELMNEAAQKLVGEHDYRNLCKMDVGNGVVNFTRRILSADVTVTKDGSKGFSMCELTVVGQAFLWHQIRCIVAVLVHVAQGKEDIGIIDELLDIEKNPKKPQYTMASELPLNLYDCDFGDGLEWVYEADWHEDNIRHLQQLWASHAVKATMIRRMLDELEVAKVETASDIAPWNELSSPLLQQSSWLIPGNKPRVYTPLLKRHMCESLEERMEHFAKRKKVASPTADQTEDGKAQPAQGD